MNTASRLPFSTSLESDHLRNSTSGTQPTPLAPETAPSTFDTPRASAEGVTICQACNNAGYIRLDEHHFEACPFC